MYYYCDTFRLRVNIHINYIRSGMAQWVVLLTHDPSVVSSNLIKGSHYFLEQKT